MLTDSTFATSPVVTALFIAIVVPTQSVLGLCAAAFDHWARRGVDVTPFLAALDGPRIPAPGGPGFPRGV